MGDLERAQTLLERRRRECRRAHRRVLARPPLLVRGAPEPRPGPSGGCARLHPPRDRSARRNGGHAAPCSGAPARRLDHVHAGPGRRGRPPLRARRALFGRNPEPVRTSRRCTPSRRGARSTRRRRRKRSARHRRQSPPPATSITREQGAALWALAESRALAGDNDAANDAYREATTVLEEHGHRRDLIEALALLGQVPPAGGPRGRGTRSARARRRSRRRADPHRRARPAVISAAVRPRGPFSLRLSSRLAGDATRTFSSGPLLAALAAGGTGRAWQQPDGVVQLRAPDEAGLEELRFVLALDDDHSEFLGASATTRCSAEPCLGFAAIARCGCRP